MLISCRLIGTAANTPSAAITANHATIATVLGAEAGEHQQRAHGRHVAAAGHVTRAEDATVLMRVVLQHAELAVDQAERPCAGRNSGEGEDAGGERDAEAPAGLEEDVEVRQAHHRPDQHPDDHRAHGELGNAGPVDRAKPALLGVLRRGRGGRRAQLGGDGGHGCGPTEIAESPGDTGAFEEREKGFEPPPLAFAARRAASLNACAARGPSARGPSSRQLARGSPADPRAP